MHALSRMLLLQLAPCFVGSGGRGKAPYGDGSVPIPFPPPAGAWCLWHRESSTPQSFNPSVSLCVPSGHQHCSLLLLALPWDPKPWGRGMLTSLPDPIDFLGGSPTLAVALAALGGFGGSGSSQAAL